MNTAVINIKTDARVKREAQKVVKELGLSLSAAINTYLRQLIRTKTIAVSTASEEPTKYFLQALKKSNKDIKAGRISPAFDNADDAIAWLKDKRHRYEGKI